MSKGSKKSRQRLRCGGTPKELSFGDISDERRLSIIKAIARGVKSKKQIANEFNVKIGAVKRINQVYLEDIKNLKAQLRHAEEVPIVEAAEESAVVVDSSESNNIQEPESNDEQPGGAVQPDLPQEPKHPAQVLLRQDVLDIYELLRKDYTTSNKIELSELYNVDMSTIQHIAQQAHGYEWLRAFGPKLTDRHATRNSRVTDHAGNRYFNRILDDDKVKEIYSKMHDEGLTMFEIVKDYGISMSTASAIRRGRGRYAKILGVSHQTSIQHRGGCVKLSPEDIINIHLKLENGASCTKCAKEYNISTQTVRGIKNPTGRYKIVIDEYLSGEIQLIDGKIVEKTDRPNPPKNGSSVEVKNSIVEFDDNLLIVPTDNALIPVEDLDRKAREMQAIGVVEQRIPATFYVPIGMCAGRHPMPCKEFVFSNISNNLIGDYGRMYEIAYKRIKEVLDANSDITIPKGIKLYVTGLAPALISIVKACTALGINLLLMHHNPRVNDFEPQDFTFYGKFNPCEADMLSLAEEIYSYGGTIDHFKKIGYGFEVLEIYATPNKSTRKSLTLILDRDEAYKYFKALSTIRRGSRIHLNSVAIGEDGVYYRKNTILKNF